MPVVAGVGVVMVALFALLAAYGAEALGKAIAQFFPQHIGIGPFGISPRSWVEAAISGAELAIGWIMGALIRPMIGFILRPVISVLGWVSSVQRFIVTAASEVQWVVIHGIPEALHAAKVYTLRYWHDARTYAASLYHLAESYAHRLYSLAEHYAHGLYVAAEHYARRIVDAATATLLGLVTEARHYAHDLYAASEHYAQRIVSSLRADVNTSLRAIEAELSTVAGVSVGYVATHIADAVKAAEAFTGTAVAGVIQVVDVDAVKGIQAAWDGILIDIGALEGVIGLDLPDIGAAVRAIPRAVPTDLADALTIVGAISIPMLRYMAKCGVPNCRNLSQIGRDLQELFSVLEGASFLALVAYIVGNPDEAAHEAHDVLGPVAHDLMGAARNLIGI